MSISGPFCTYGLVEVSFPTRQSTGFLAQLTIASKDEKRREMVTLTRLSPPPKDWYKAGCIWLQRKKSVFFSKRVNKTVETESSTITQTSSVIHLDCTGAKTHTK